MVEVHGIYPILYAFFGADGKLDRSAMRRQAEACIEMGAHGIAALGLATEVSKLSSAERHDVMAWLAEDRSLSSGTQQKSKSPSSTPPPSSVPPG